jgi:hypothetical protein
MQRSSNGISQLPLWEEAIEMMEVRSYFLALGKRGGGIQPHLPSCSAVSAEHFLTLHLKGRAWVCCFLNPDLNASSILCAQIGVSSILTSCPTPAA